MKLVTRIWAFPAVTVHLWLSVSDFMTTFDLLTSNIYTSQMYLAEYFYQLWTFYNFPYLRQTNRKTSTRNGLMFFWKFSLPIG